MTKPLRRKLFLLLTAIALLAGSFILIPASAVEAAGSYCDWTYYSDATYTTIVGERIKTCQGQVSGWGTVTVYKIGGCEPCGPPGGR